MTRNQHLHWRRLGGGFCSMKVFVGLPTRCDFFGGALADFGVADFSRGAAVDFLGVVIGGWGRRSRLRGAVSPTSFQTVRAGFPHTAYGWDFTMQHARLRVADGAAQSVQTQCFVGFPLPENSLAGLGVSSVASPPKHVQPSDDVLVELAEFPSCVPGGEVGAPASEHWVQVVDEYADVLHPASP